MKDIGLGGNTSHVAKQTKLLIDIFYFSYLLFAYLFTKVSSDKQPTKISILVWMCLRDEGHWEEQSMNFLKELYGTRASCNHHAMIWWHPVTSSLQASETVEVLYAREEIFVTSCEVVRWPHLSIYKRKSAKKYIEATSTAPLLHRRTLQ
jgi:hypothetical protein